MEGNPYSVGMALVDFLPVLLFGAGAVIFQRDLYNKMSKGAFALFAAGTIDVLCAGALKALYKLLYAMNVCDFSPLSAMFFPVQSIGFLLAGIGVVAMLVHRQGETLAAVAAPAAFSGTFLFVSLMVIGLGGMNFGIATLAKRLKKPIAAVLLAVTFFCCMGMGYLSSKDFANPMMNWLAEGINIVGQGCYLLAAILLHRAGLASLRLEKKA